MREVQPPRFVHVRVDDRWHDGFLRAWRRRPGGPWEAFVTYSVGVGSNRLDWLPATRLRPPT